MGNLEPRVVRERQEHRGSQERKEAKEAEDPRDYLELKELLDHQANLECPGCKA